MVSRDLRKAALPNIYVPSFPSHHPAIVDSTPPETTYTVPVYAVLVQVSWAGVPDFLEAFFRPLFCCSIRAKRLAHFLHGH